MNSMSNEYIETDRGAFQIMFDTIDEAAEYGFRVRFMHGDYAIVSDGCSTRAVHKSGDVTTYRRSAGGRLIVVEAARVPFTAEEALIFSVFSEQHDFVRYGYCAVSDGTMHIGDLAAAFIHFLHDNFIEKYGVACKLFSRRELSGEEDLNDECAFDRLLQLCQIMGSVAPRGYRFGVSEGSSSCYGYWPEENEGEENEQ